MRPLQNVVLLATFSISAACSSVGPKTITRDQFDYGSAISTAWKEQLLFNVVGMRYLDAPVFVNVASVINQYTLEGNVALGATVDTGVGGDEIALGGSGKYTDRPTITYAPIAGQDFARSLLSPIEPESLFALVQAGWPADFVLRLTVRSINGLNSEWAGPSDRRQADPRFDELIRVWSRLSRERLLGLRRETVEGSSRILVHRKEAKIDDPQTLADLNFFYETLGLDPNKPDYRLSYGLVPRQDEIVVLTSSILEIINELAWRIDVPEEHVAERRTGTTFRLEDPQATPLIRISYSKERPEAPYAAVHVRDYWFYLDDRDIASKRTFLMVQIMLSLTESSTTARGPVVSIAN